MQSSFRQGGSGRLKSEVMTSHGVTNNPPEADSSGLEMIHLYSKLCSGKPLSVSSSYKHNSADNFTIKTSIFKPPFTS